jgi:hypothetical protein
MADRAMVEASMLLHRDSANYLLAIARTGRLDVVISKRLLDLAASEPEVLIRNVAPRLGILPRELDVSVIRHLARELQPIVEGYTLPPESDRSHWYDGGNRPFRTALFDLVADELTADILFDEWYFLTSESWLYSKTRQAFDAFVEAGGTAIHMSGRLFDRVTRVTLKKQPDADVAPASRVRAAAKWVAVAGPAILSVVEPISGALTTAASGFFLLVDP